KTVAEIACLPGGPTALPVAADVSDEEAVADAVSAIDRQWGRIDALVNNAAWMPPRQRVLDIELSLLHRVFSSKVVGSFLMTKHAAPIMIREGGGRIVY